MKSLSVALSLVLFLSSTLTAGSVDLSRFFGHDVQVAGQDPDRKLTIDGRVMHTDAIFSFDEMAMIGNVPVLIGSSSAGGNACDSAPFVVSFPAASDVRFDGPVETCYSTTYEISSEGIVFSTNDIPGEGTQRWRWTFDNGMEKLETIAFKPDPMKGWTALRERKLDHPSNVFSNGEIAASLQQLLGQDFPFYQRVLTGVGGGSFDGDDYIGTSCTPHNCGTEEALIFLSASERKVYAAWKPEAQKIVVRPPVKEWPEKAKNKLRTWAEKWK